MNRMTRFLYTAAVAALAGTGLYGCSPKAQEGQTRQTPVETPVQVERYEFTSMGEIATIRNGFDSSVSVDWGDADGDGDLDLVVAGERCSIGNNSAKKIVIYENKIPQKGLENQLGSR